MTVGASGALFGLMAALLVVAVKVRGDVQALLTLVAINVVITVLGARVHLLAGPPRRVRRRPGAGPGARLRASGAPHRLAGRRAVTLSAVATAAAVVARTLVLR